MTEQEWLASQDPDAMVREWLRRTNVNGIDRKARLLGCAFACEMCRATGTQGMSAEQLTDHGPKMTLTRPGKCPWCGGRGEVPRPGLLAHLRSPGPHVRGCHVLDLILGKE